MKKQTPPLRWMTTALAMMLAVCTQAELVWYSPMDGNANPEPGYGPTPAAVGAPAATTNRFNEADSAVYFSGSDYYNLGKPVSSFIASTVACWINYQALDTSSRGLVGIGGSYSYGSGPFFSMLRVAGTAGETLKLRSDYSIGNGSRKDVFSNTFSLGDWHHVVMSFEIVGVDTVHRIYVDGQLMESDTYTGYSTALTPGRDWLVGCQNTDSDKWIGIIDDVGIWDVALTDAEIAELAGGTKLPTEVGITLNVPPVADAGPDHYVFLPTNSVTLTATADDADGTIASNLWEQLSSPAVTLIGGNSLALTVNDLVPGRYDFQFTTFDDGGASHGDIVSVFVSDRPKLVWYSPMDGDAAPPKPSLGNPPIATNGTPTPTADRNGNPDAAMFFDGDDDYYTLAKQTPVFFQGTIALWARLDDTSVTIQTNLVITVTTNEFEEVTTTTNMTFQTLPVVSRGLVAVGGSYSYGSGPFFCLIHVGGEPGETLQLRTDYSIGNGSRLDVFSGFHDIDAWHHMATTFEIGEGNTILNIYVDGVLDNTRTYPGYQDGLVPGKDWLIGTQNTDGNKWLGAIDDVAIWNAALTPEQIQLLANGARIPSDFIHPHESPTSMLIIR